MTCTNCRSEFFRVLKVFRGENTDKRLIICKGCGSEFMTITKIAAKLKKDREFSSDLDLKRHLGDAN